MTSWQYNHKKKNVSVIQFVPANFAQVFLNILLYSKILFLHYK